MGREFQDRSFSLGEIRHAPTTFQLRPEIQHKVGQRYSSGIVKTFKALKPWDPTQSGAEL